MESQKEGRKFLWTTQRRKYPVVKGINSPPNGIHYLNNVLTTDQRRAFNEGVSLFFSLLQFLNKKLFSK